MATPTTTDLINQATTLLNQLQDFANVPKTSDLLAQAQAQIATLTAANAQLQTQLNTANAEIAQLKQDVAAIASADAILNTAIAKAQTDAV